MKHKEFPNFDFLIVGQGLAGTLLAHFLKRNGKSFKIIDKHNPNTASQIAAGIINPVTGRRFVKSWRIDEFLPFAQSIYSEIEKELKIEFVSNRNILRCLFNQKEENDWLLRTGEIPYQKYLSDTSELKEFEQKIKPVHGYGEILGAAQINIPTLVAAYRKLFQKEDSLIDKEVDYQSVINRVGEEPFFFEGNYFKKIVCCEGYGLKNNPLFSWLPFTWAKGEVLIVNIPNANFERMLKHKTFIVPLGANNYWIGSNYDWNFENETPTKEGKEYLIEALEKCLDVPYEIVEHLAAVRPTIKDRRPVLGWHPENEQIAIFNGLGTKGASLGPYFAKQMCDFLINQDPVESEVSIKRFANDYSNTIN